MSKDKVNVGRRKAAVARVVLKPGTGVITVNGKTIKIISRSILYSSVLRRLLIQQVQQANLTLALTYLAAALKARLMLLY